MFFEAANFIIMMGWWWGGGTRGGDEIRILKSRARGVAVHTCRAVVCRKISV